MQSRKNVSQAGRIHSWEWLLFSIIILVKLTGISTIDVRAGSFPIDDEWMIQKAASWYWGDAYHYLAYIKEPLMPFFIRVCFEIGIPLRIALEILLAAVALFFAAGIPRQGVNAGILRILTFASIILFPDTLSVFSVATADPLYVCLMVLWVGIALRLFIAIYSGNPGFGLGAGMGLCSGLLCIARPEYQITWIMLCTVITGGVCMHWMGCARSKPLRGRLVLAITILGITGFIMLSVELVNYFRVGFFGVSEQTERSFRRAFAALRSVPSPQAEQYVLIDNPTLCRVAEVSDSARQIVPSLVGPMMKWNSILGIDYVPKNTPAISAGNFVWAIRDAVQLSSNSTSARATSRFYARLADEIEAAQRQGRLPKQSILTYYQNSASQQYIPVFVRSFLNVFRAFMQPADMSLPKDGAFLSHFVIENFDWMASRRKWSSTAIPSRMETEEIRGWIVNTNQPAGLARIEFESSTNNLRLGYKWLVYPRPGVAAYCGFPQTEDSLFGFVLYLPCDTTVDSVVFVDSKQLRYRVKLDYLRTRKASGGITLSTIDQESHALCWIDYNQRYDFRTHQRSEYSQIKSMYLQRYWQQLVKIWPWLICCAMAFLLISWLRSTTCERKLTGIIFGVILSVIAERLAMLVLLDINYAPGCLPRYICPVSILIIPSLLFLGAWCVHLNQTQPRRDTDA